MTNTAPDQHGFRPDHSTTSVLRQSTTDITMGFNQRKAPARTVCVAVDLMTILTRGVKSTPASRKALNCRHCCSASTLPTCLNQQNQSSGSAMLMTQLCRPHEHTPSQDIKDPNGLTAITGPMPKDLRSPHGHLTNIQQA